MTLLLLKLSLTPILIGGASLAARRWGPSVGGWIVAFPLTSGPVALYVALDQGAAFAAGTARGSIAGLLGDAAFALGYGWLASRLPWPGCTLAGFGCFLIAALAMQPLTSGPVLILFGVVALLMLAMLRLAPQPAEAVAAPPPPRWDIPARVLVGTSIVLVITAAASTVGPHWSGVAAAFPVYVTVLAVFAHRFSGAPSAMAVVRGLQFGLFGTIVFFLVISTAVEQVGIGPAFVLAICATLAVQAVSIRLLRPPETSVAAP